MNERVVYQVAMWASVGLGVVSGLATVIMLAEIAEYGIWLLIPAFFLACASAACAYGTVHFAQRFAGHEKVFANPIEQEVLTSKQRRELRRKRGELVMHRSLNEIENERDNIVHRQLEAANDPDKPPHDTRFSPLKDQDRRRITPGHDWNDETEKWERRR